jgi:thiol:disulfide interchange protein
MRAVRCTLALALALAAPAALRADAASNSADVAHLHVQLVVPGQTLRQGAATDAGLYFKLDPGWHIYWKNAGDSGEPPHVKWTLPDGITASDLEFPPPKRLPLGPLMDFGYENEVLFPFHFDVADSAKRGPAVLHAKVDWLVCQNVCIPGKAELEVKRDVVPNNTPATTGEPDAGLWERWGKSIPGPLAGATAVFESTPSGFRLQFESGRRESKAEFFPADQNILDNPSPQKVTPTAKGLILELKKDANLSAAPSELKGVLELSSGRAYEIAATPGTVALPAPAPAGPSLLRVVGLAFLGGLLLNLMPCVFPVLFLKGLALVNSGSEERHKLRNHGFVYAAGILVSFWALVAALLALRAAGGVLGWGFQFQSPVFLALMAGLLFFLGLSLAGQFEIGLSLTSAGGSLAAKQGYAGSFFTGVLAVIVATPCTAPFMAAAIGYALAQPPAITFAVFTALALGLAAPYVALTLQPAWTRLLPKPGAWMEVLRQAVSVPIFGTVIWLAWVLANAYGAAVLAALLVGFLLLGIAGWFLGRWPARRWATSMASLIVLSFVGIVVYGQRLAGQQAIQTAVAQNGATKAVNAWQPWSADAVARYQSQGRPVFVDFTASWCLSCQVNERVVLDRPEVIKAFEDNHVVLLKADWTREDPAITQALAALGRSGVPVYALYAPGHDDPELLPQVLTPGIVTDALEKLPKPATQASAAASNLK